MGDTVNEYESIFSPIDFLQVIWKRFWVVLLVSIVLVGATVGFSLVQTPVYEGSIKILIGQQRGITETPADVTGLQQVTLTMAEGVSTRPVAEAVIRQQNLDITPENFLDNLSVQQIGTTQFIQVTYNDSSPEQAARVANAIGEVFSQQVSEVSPSANAITATVWEQAAVPDEPVSPDPTRNGLLALVLALMLGVGLAVLLDLLDDSWHSAEEVERITGVPTFGTIPEIGAAKDKRDNYGGAKKRRG